MWLLAVLVCCGFGCFVFIVVLLVYLLEGFRWCRSGSVCFDCLFACTCVSGYDVWWLGWGVSCVGLLFDDFVLICTCRG